MEKNKLLKVTSIILIVIGVILALIAILMFVAGDLFASLIGIVGDESGVTGAEQEAAAALVKTVMTIIGVATLIEAIAYIAAGVIGVQQKSVQLCFIVAIILVVLCGVSAIMNIAEGSVILPLIGLILPVLYLVGAIQLKKAAADEAITATSEEQNI